MIDLQVSQENIATSFYKKNKNKILPKITKFLEYQNVNKMYKKLQRKCLGFESN